MEPLHHLSSDTTDQPTENSISAETHKRLFQRGLKWLGAGMFLLVAGAGINFLMFNADTSFTTVMYTVTSVGGILVLKGIVDIFGF